MAALIQLVKQIQIKKITEDGYETRKIGADADNISVYTTSETDLTSVLAETSGAAKYTLTNFLNLIKQQITNLENKITTTQNTANSFGKTLKISQQGGNPVSYTGKEAKEINITRANLGAASDSDLTTHKNQAATTSVKGHVQLSNAINSSSESIAATSNAVKLAYDRASNALNGLNNKLNISDGLTLKGVHSQKIQVSAGGLYWCTVGFTLLDTSGHFDCNLNEELLSTFSSNPSDYQLLSCTRVVNISNNAVADTAVQLTAVSLIEDNNVTFNGKKNLKGHLVGRLSRWDGAQFGEGSVGSNFQVRLLFAGPRYSG